jgi:hypothetical protein
MKRTRNRRWRNIMGKNDEIQKTRYEVESVNMSQMDVKRKTCDIRTWEIH